MSRPLATIGLGLVVIGLAVVASGQPTMGGGGFSELYRVEVADEGDLEVVMGLIERDGESIGARHYHPSGEFGFVLEGVVTITTEREQSVVLKAGASFYRPPGEWHAVSTASAGAKTVVFRIVKKGQRMIVAAD